MFADKTLVCRECGAEFTWTAGEQEFYQSRGLLNEPRRCPGCRATRRRDRAPREERESYEIVCDECGCTAHVPFQPMLDRPVYCNDCYAAIRERRREQV